jgi:hypothetical protein
MPTQRTLANPPPRLQRWRRWLRPTSRTFPRYAARLNISVLREGDGDALNIETLAASMHASCDPLSLSALSLSLSLSLSQAEEMPRFMAWREAASVGAFIVR